MRLTDLSPRWIGVSGWAQQPSPRIGLTFECPCCRGTERATRLAIRFDPPIDPDALLQNTTWVFGGGSTGAGLIWGRQGETFEDLTLSPSVDAQTNHGHWHGHITNGEAA